MNQRCPDLTPTPARSSSHPAPSWPIRKLRICPAFIASGFAATLLGPPFQRAFNMELSEDKIHLALGRRRFRNVDSPLLIRYDTLDAFA